jgi:hypothetical protein
MALQTRSSQSRHSERSGLALSELVHTWESTLHLHHSLNDSDGENQYPTELLFC